MTRSYLIPAGLVSAWLLVLAAGQFWFLKYQSDPGPLASAAGWPAGSTLRPSAGRFALLFFAHPRCPCTRAGLADLSWALARSQGKVDAFAVFVLPEGAPAGWERTPLWDIAGSIPGVRPVSDLGGEEATRFRVATSGQTLLFDPHGTLVFSGGITGGRGHSGDNPARRALVECFADRMPDRREFSVFGCPLFGADRSCREGAEECIP